MHMLTLKVMHSCHVDPELEVDRGWEASQRTAPSYIASYL